jgi:predicted nucleic acid-binding protein
MAGKLLDTTVLIDLSRKNVAAADFIDNERRLGTELFVSIVSAMELIVGCRDKQEVAKAEKLVADFLLIQLNPAISQKAYELILAFSKSHGLMIPDALIAATALMESLELMSDNDRHFKMIPNLTVGRPY